MSTQGIDQRMVNVHYYYYYYFYAVSLLTIKYNSPAQHVLFVHVLVFLKYPQVHSMFRVQELRESRGGHPGLSIPTSLTVSVNVKQHWTMLRHWSQFVPNMSTDIQGHEALHHHPMLAVKVVWATISPHQCILPLNCVCTRTVSLTPLAAALWLWGLQ